MTPAVLVTGGAGYVGSHACKALATSGFRRSPTTTSRPGIAGPSAGGHSNLVTSAIPPGLRSAAAPSRGRGPAFRSRGTGRRGDARSGAVLRRQRHGDAPRARGLPRGQCPPAGLSSSCATYGVPEHLPIAESAEQRPINPYGASKLVAERMVADFARAYGLARATLRYFNAAGADPDAEIGEARETETHLVPLALDAVRGVRPPVAVMGVDYPTADGTAIRDYVHVADLADGHVAALRRLLAAEASLILNLGVGRGHSVLEVLQAIETVTGRPVPFVRAARREAIRPCSLPTRLARALLGLTFPRSQSLQTIVGDAWRWHKVRGHARAA